MVLALKQHLKARPLLDRWAARLGLGGVVAGPATIHSQMLGTQPPDLVGLYKCDEASGPLIDYSGNGNNLAVQGTGHTYQEAER